MFDFSFRRPFKDRNHAGELLARNLIPFSGRDTIVLAIPRGGVVVGGRIAQELRIPLDVIVTKKIGAPQNPELAIGAVGSGSEVVWDRKLIDELEIPQKFLEFELEKQQEEAQRRENVYREGKGKYNLENKVVILVDDGVATGHTILAAVKRLKKMNPKKLILAVPLAPKSSVEQFSKYFDEVIALKMPESFSAVGQFYQEFLPVSDEDVVKILKKFT